MSGPIHTLLRGGTFITYNDALNDIEIIENGSLLMADTTIVDISSIIDGLDESKPPETDVVDTRGMIISPGFIDTHRHGWQTAMRTTGPNIQLAQYLWTYGIFGPAVFSYTPRDVFIGQLIGQYEALNAGVTTTLEHAHMTWSREHAEASLNAVVESGARVMWAYTIAPVVTSAEPSLTFNFHAPADQLAHVHELAIKRPFSENKVTLGIAFDGISSAEGPMSDLTKTVLKSASSLSLSVFTSHFAGIESPYGGTSQIQALKDLGLLDTKVPLVFSHGMGITQDDMKLLRSSNHFLSITPESEMHYGHGQPHSHEILDQAALGIDTHFTFSTDILTQMRIWLQSTRLRLYQQHLDAGFIPTETPMTVKQAFLLGTRNGGLALRRPDLGVLKVGAKADIVVFDTSSPGLIGWSDPIAAVVLHANVGDISHVFVDGKFVKKNGKLVVDLDPFVDEFKASAAKWHDVLSKTDLSPYKAGVLQLLGWSKPLAPPPVVHL